MFIPRRRHVVSSNQHHDADSKNIYIYIKRKYSIVALKLDDKIGSFEVGKDFDALVVDVYGGGGQIDRYPYSVAGNEEERVIALLQRFVYVGDDRNITQVYVKGRNVKNSR